MESVMLSAICPGIAPSQEIIQEVRDFIDLSTGKLTILQMEWLAEKGGPGWCGEKSLSAAEYKKIYLKELMVCGLGAFASS